jgi:NAD(P)H-hydrate epimerase
VARHLHNRGCGVAIGLCGDPAGYKGDALINWRIVSAMKIPAAPFNAAMLSDPQPMLIIDAIFGTGLTEAPREPFASITETINSSGLPILSIDVPSGMDCDRGSPPGACIRANCTVTFVAGKTGFTNPNARRYLGNVIVGDIGCPAELVQKVARGK